MAKLSPTIDLEELKKEMMHNGLFVLETPDSISDGQFTINKETREITPTQFASPNLLTVLFNKRNAAII